MVGDGVDKLSVITLPTRTEHRLHLWDPGPFTGRPSRRCTEVVQGFSGLLSIPVMPAASESGDATDVDRVPGRVHPGCHASKNQVEVWAARLAARPRTPAKAWQCHDLPEFAVQ